MALTDFLFQTCNVTTKTYVNDAGSQKATVTTIYSGIKCKLYRDKKRSEITDEALNVDKENLKLILEADKTGIVANDEVEVFDPDEGSLGKYLVESSPKVNRTIDGRRDSVVLTLKKAK